MLPTHSTQWNHSCYQTPQRLHWIDQFTNTVINLVVRIHRWAIGFDPRPFQFQTISMFSACSKQTPTPLVSNDVGHRRVMYGAVEVATGSQFPAVQETAEPHVVAEPVPTVPTHSGSPAATSPYPQFPQRQHTQHAPLLPLTQVPQRRRQ